MLPADIFERLRDEWERDTRATGPAKVAWTWEVPPEILALGDEPFYHDVCDAYALIEFPEGHAIMLAYVSGRDKWVSSKGGYAARELLRQRDAAEDELRQLRAQISTHYQGLMPARGYFT